jgi:hypothetical protein
LTAPANGRRQMIPINIHIKIKGMQTESNDKLLKAETKLAKAYNDIATIKAKCESLEKFVSKEKK